MREDSPHTMTRRVGSWVRMASVGGDGRRVGRSQAGVHGLRERDGVVLARPPGEYRG